MRRLTRKKIVGKHWRRAKCFRRKNSLRTSIITVGQIAPKFGYRVQNNPRGDFEIEGVSKELIERFSKRHREIDEKTKELLEREPEKANQNIKVIRANIAHKERARKIKDVGIVKLQSIWNKQLSWGEWWQVKHLAQGHIALGKLRRARERRRKQNQVGGRNHLFERRSVVHVHELWRHALEHAPRP